MFPTLIGLLTFGGTLEKMVARAQVPRIAAANGQAIFPYNSENVTKVFAWESFLVIYGMFHSTYGDLIWEQFAC